jgi:hypothetical protein
MEENTVDIAGKKIIQNFDYGSIKPEHLEAIREVCNILDSLNQSLLSSHIQEKFKIIPRKKYDAESSKFLKFLEENNVNVNFAGFTVHENVEYPLVCVLEDIRVLEKVFEKYI